MSTRVIAVLERVPGIPGNGVIIPGHRLIGEERMLMGTISPEPKKGKQTTVDFLVREHIKPHASRDQLGQSRGIVHLYEGLEPDTIFCLSYALQGKKFEEASSAFLNYYQNVMRRKRLPSWMRCTSEEIFDFFSRMYLTVDAKKYRRS